MAVRSIDSESPIIRIYFSCLQLKNREDTFFRAQQMDINKLAAARMRARRILAEIDDFEEIIGGLLGMHMAEMLREEYIWLFRNATFTKEVKQQNDQITDSDIEAAKRYPIDRLIQFTRGQALAFCHDDKKPSLFHGTRKNKAICPVCNRTFNPIDVLMYRDQMSFIDAVKQLRNR